MLPRRTLRSSPGRGRKWRYVAACWPWKAPCQVACISAPRAAQVNRRGRHVRLHDAQAAPATLYELDVEHARHRLDGAGDLRRNLEAAGQLDLDLGAAAELEDHADLAVALGIEPFGDRLQRRLVTQEHPQPLLELRRGLVERLGGLDASADLVALRLGAEKQ